MFSGKQDNPTLLDGISKMDEAFEDNIGKLLSRSGISSIEIDVLVINIAMLSTIPSLAARIINRYKLRDDIKVFNLTAMGCSASLISIDIVKNLFKSYRNLIALVVSSEFLVPNWYSRNQRLMILPNCLFWFGGCAILLTNKRAMKHKAMFRLKYLVRTQHGARYESYNCCMQKEDDQGKLGIYLGKTLLKAASKALVHNLREMAPKILPVRELLRFIIMLFVQKLS